MALEVLTNVYTSKAEMADLFSHLGVRLRIEDLIDNLTDPNVHIKVVIDHATDVVNQYIERRYKAGKMVDNLWIRYRATVIACHLLSMRRANVGQFKELHDKVIEDLKAVRQGKIDVPRLGRESPAVKNIVIDRRFINEQQVVDDTNPLFNIPWW